MKKIVSYAYIIILCCVYSFAVHNTLYAGTLTCTVSTSCPTGTIIYRMSSTTNAHAETASQSNYTQVVCCSGVTGLGNSCLGTFATALKLSSTTNAHVEQNTQVNYANSACISVANGTVSLGYRATDCTGYDTTVGSMSSTSNAHAGNAAAFNTKICATGAEVVQSLTFSISDNSIGFGTLLASGVRYATGDGIGSGSDTSDPHTISVSTNASSGYSATLSGTTLTCSACGGATVTPIGATALASSVGTEQFGLRLTVNSGTGTVSSPYNGANWAFDSVAMPDLVMTGSGDGVTTVFGARYMTNISANTETGDYSSVLTYTVTATY